MTFPLLTHREIDFVKKEEELKKSLDEKDKWYKEQLETLQRRVRAPPWAWGVGGQNSDALMQLSGAPRDDDVTLRCFVCRSLPWSLEERRPGRVRVVATRRQTTD